MPTVYQGSRVQHPCDANRQGTVSLITLKRREGETRPEPYAEVRWDTDWPTWHFVADLVLAKGSLQRTGRRKRKGG